MFITLDIGGSRCRIAMFTGLARSSLSRVENVVIKNDADKDFQSIFNEIDRLQSTRGNGIEAIAVGIAGSLSKDHNVLENSVNLSKWEGVDIRNKFIKKYDCKVFIENDTFMAGFGEGHYGVVKEDFLYINWGTGIGGCLVNFSEKTAAGIGNKINDPSIKGFKDGILDIRATELGHQIIVQKGERCRCGQRGCLDMYVGGHSIEFIYKKQAIDLNLTEWKEVVERMALGIMNAVVVYPVGYVVMGGGIALNQFEKVKHIEYLINKKLKIIHPPKLLLASLDDYAGLYGGISYIKNNIEFIR